MLSKAEAKSIADRAYNQCQGLLTEFASIVGSEELNVRLLVKDIKRLKTKEDINETMKEQLLIKKLELKKIKNALSLLKNKEQTDKKNSI